MSLLKHMERWKNVEGYEGLYQVSNCGRVKSLERYRIGNSGYFEKVKEKILKPHKNRYGYLQVILYNEDKRKLFLIHRLVAKAFISNPNNFPCINHKDENKENNCVWNLEWCDHKYNNNYGTAIERRSKKLSKQVLCIETNKVYQSTIEVEKQTGIKNSSISQCCNGKRKTAGGFLWKFID